MQTINERIDRIEADLTETERQERQAAKLDVNDPELIEAERQAAAAADEVTGYAVITENPRYGWELFTTHRTESDAQELRDALTKSNPLRKVDVIRGGNVMATGECDRRNEEAGYRKLAAEASEWSVIYDDGIGWLLYGIYQDEADAQRTAAALRARGEDLIATVLRGGATVAHADCNARNEDRPDPFRYGGCADLSEAQIIRAGQPLHPAVN